MDASLLITGASSGIGNAIARRFASDGARLILTWCRNKTGGLETAERCRTLGAAEVSLLKLDVRSLRSISSLTGRIGDKYGEIDFLVNNAGTGVMKPFAGSTVPEILDQLRTNLEGTILVTHALLPLVRKGIVNIGSFLSKHASEDLVVYCGSKFGVRGFTQSLAKEVRGIRICCVNPDLTSTRLTGFEGRPPEEVAELVHGVITGRVGCEEGGDVDIWEMKG